MKIFQTNLLQNNKNIYRTTKYQPMLKMNNEPDDTFVKSEETTTPSFRMLPKKACQQVLENPSLLQKYMLAITTGASAGFLALVKGASGEENLEDLDAENTNILQNLFGFMNNKTQAVENDSKSKMDEYEQRIAELEKKNQELTAQLRNKETKTTKAEKVSAKKVEIKENNTSGQKPKVEDVSIFPKRKTAEGKFIGGRVSKNIEKLKKEVDSISFPEELKPKVIAICKELIEKNSHNLNGTVTQNSDIAGIFAEQLSQAKENQNDLEKVVDDFYKICGINNDTSVSNIKVVGKIDLDKINSSSRPKSRKRIITENKELAESSGKMSRNETTGDFDYRVPGTIDSDFGKNLKTLIIKFQKEVGESEEYKDKKIKWKFNEAIGVVNEAQILDEIQKQKKKGANKAYNNINEKEIYRIVDAINSDERFQKYFTLHSALRLIDRYVKFDENVDGEYVSIEDQIINVLDNLIKTIHTSFSRGVDIQIYEDFAYKAIAPKAMIPSEYYSEEARKIFGSFPLYVTFCENQPSSYYNKYRKQGLVCTVFSDGI